jgi:hypothetical protein
VDAGDAFSALRRLDDSERRLLHARHVGAGGPQHQVVIAGLEPAAGEAPAPGLRRVNGEPREALPEGIRVDQRVRLAGQ